MKLKSLLLASTVVLVAATGAKAADAVVYEEPVAVVAAPVFSWTGGYLGGQVGYGWGKSRFSVEDGEGSFNLKPDGFLGGLYAGYNFDLGNSVVLGVDGDVTYNNLKDSGTLFEGEDSDVSLESKLRWSGAVRARAGYAVDRFLPYIAGGVAFGSVKNTISGDDVNLSQTKTQVGWTAGAGVDYAATDNIIVRLEYRYTDYGRKDYDFGVDAGLRDKFKTNEVRLGVAYKF